jgi:ferritin-like metal-binding protein YciE
MICSLHTLQDIYYAENKIVKSLPDMIGNVGSSVEARAAKSPRGNEDPREQARAVFKMLGKSAKSVNCPAIDGIITEAGDVSGEVADKTVLDAAMIASAQAVEHYEMTRYGSLIAWANRLGRSDVARLLQQTLDEEKAADKKLTQVAESAVNLKAAS